MGQGANSLAMLLQQALGGGIGNSQAGPQIATPPTFDPTLQGAPDPTAALGGGGDAGGSNPLATLMAQAQAGGGAGAAPAPQPQAQAPQAPPPMVPVTPQTPTKTTKTDDEITQLYRDKAKQIDAEYAQLKQTTNALQTKVAQPVSSDIPPELLSFDKYNEQRYQEAYGGGGKLGVAGRALANFLSGGVSGKGIRETMTEQNQKDWQIAVTQAAQRVQAEKASLNNQVQINNQRLAQLTADANQNKAMEQAAIAAYKATNLSSQKANFKDLGGPGMTGAQLKAVLGRDWILGADDKQVPIDDQGFYKGQMLEGRVVNGAPTTIPAQYKTDSTWVKADAQHPSPTGWLKVSYYPMSGVVAAMEPGQPGGDIAGRQGENTQSTLMTRADGSTYLQQHVEGYQSGPSNQPLGGGVTATPAATPQTGAVPKAPTAPGSPAAASPTPPQGAAVHNGLPGGGNRVVAGGEKPFTPAERQQFANADSGLEAITKLRGMLDQSKGQLLLAAIPGSPGARDFAATRAEIIDVLTRLRTGAALNKDEEELYKKQLPTLLDLTDPEAMKNKLDRYEKLFNRLHNREVLPNEQKKANKPKVWNEKTGKFD